MKSLKEKSEIKQRKEREEERRTTGTVPDAGWGGEWRDSVEKKRGIWHLVICVGLVCLIWGGYYFAESKIEQIIEPTRNTFSWVYQVDSVQREEKELVLEGFAFNLEKDAANGNFEIVLQNIESGKCFYPTMEYMRRDDVNNYFLCEYDYTESGFKAKMVAKKLKLEKNDYEVLVRVADGRTAYKTGIYLSKGELMFVNPKEYIPLEVEGTDLKMLTDEGVLRVYNPDYHMYVYQYEGELYWIADKEYGFVEGDTQVQYQLDTTQIENLPKHRLENEWYWDNIEFTFSKYELKDWNTGKYRVTKKALPVEYSVTRIQTGNHVDGEWVWTVFFRPWYEFSKNKMME